MSPAMISRVLAAALAAGAASAITILTFTNSACTGIPVGSLTVFADVCAPQFGAAFAAQQAPVASFSAGAVTGGGASPVTSVNASGYANSNCGGTAAITATVTTTCAALTGLTGFYAKLSGDAVVKASDTNGAYYMGIFGATGCAAATLAADLTSGGSLCTPNGGGAGNALQVTVTTTGVSTNIYMGASVCTGTPTNNAEMSYTFGTCAAGPSQICTAAGLPPACFVKTSAVSAFPAAAKSGASAAALSSLVAALALAVAAAAAAAF